MRFRLWSSFMCDVEHPMQAVLDAPMMADNLMKAICGKRRAEEIIGCFRCGFPGRLADTRHLADGGEPRPLMALLKPGDIR